MAQPEREQVEQLVARLVQAAVVARPAQVAVARVAPALMVASAAAAAVAVAVVAANNRRVAPNLPRMRM
jgi:hypothetical protein